MKTRNIRSLPFFFANGFFIFATFIFAQPAQAQFDAILVSCDEQSVPSVRILSGETTLNPNGLKHGLLFVPPSEKLPERWTPVQEKIPSLDELQNELLRTVGPSRNSGGAIADSIAAQTVQLEQLQAFVTNRNLPRYAESTIFSPADGSVLLNPCPTIRRLPATDEKTKEQHYPPLVARIFSSSQPILEIPFAKDQKSLHWEEIPQLPQRFREGLPSGDYEIQTPGAIKRNRFTVKSPELRHWMDSRFSRLESLLGKDDPVTVQIAAETLIQDTKDGPFLTDALDRIGSLPLEKSTPYLETLNSAIAFRMSGREGVVRGSNGELPLDEKERSDKAKADEDPVADSEFIRQLLLNEKWNAASERLERLEKTLSQAEETTKTRELQALCHLYRGMILAESGAAQLQAGYAEFAQAMQLLDAIAEADPQAVAMSRYRCANNFGNYLLRLTQDRLYNHALSIATGDGTVLTGALYSWSEAMGVYQKALQILSQSASENLQEQPELAATTKINMARLYALLGDIVRTVDVDQTATEIEKAAYATASKWAEEVVAQNLSGEERLCGAAHHILADLAFRQKDETKCREEAGQTRKFYVQTGTLSGVEAVERLLGMLSTTDTKAALQHLLISNTISESLWEQIPEDKIGLSQAGFFARRAYVNERLIELLLQENRPVEALKILEAAKGRSLQAVLGMGNGEWGIGDSEGSVDSGWWMVDSEESSNHNSSPTNHKPQTTNHNSLVALEYFVGSGKSWGFLICNGKVEAFAICDANGKPIPSRDLIATVQQYLSDMELQAVKMKAKVVNSEAFDPEWEATLYQLRTALIPDPILAKIRASGPRPLGSGELKPQLLIVPHHILHYLPFSALVVERDKDMQPGTLPQPKFLLDESFDVFYAPSLLVWNSLHQRPNRPVNQFAVVGISRFSHAPALEGVKEDVAHMQSAFGSSRVQSIEEDDATKQAVKDVLLRRGLLLIATHGTNWPSQPLYGRLALRTESGEDDAITAEEIYETTVGSDLVMLSACYSGLADQSPMPGDDLFGIQRALLHGGARSVISGVWDVYDFTGPIIIEKLLQNLAEGKPAVAALNTAQRTFLEKEREEGANNPWTHPYFWAVYTLNGDGRVFCNTEKP